MTPTAHPRLLPDDTTERVAYLGLLAMVATVQFSIVVAEIALAVALVAWLVLLWGGRTQVEVPRAFVPLGLYAALTLVSALLSRDPRASLADCKQLLLLLVVPAVYVLAPGRRASRLLHVVITMGAVSAIVGVVQYGVFNYDFLGQRPRGSLGHYMTYSGLLMLVISVTVARLLFEKKDRVWPALVLPALIVAVELTFSRSAWVGTCVGVAILLMLKDLRLVAVLPVVAALVFILAPPRVADRIYSMVNLQDPTTRDRVAMLKAGAKIVKRYPLFGVGPNMIEQVYPVYRTSDAVERNEPHLHNVPIQIAAERGLPALAAWLWFVGGVTVQLWKRRRTARRPFLVASGLGAMGAMLGAGLFEHNFGDSEFLLLWLVIVTLPFAAEREPGPEARSTAAMARAA